MVQDHLSKEEVGKLMDQRVYIVTITQELQNLTNNCFNITSDYLGEESPLCLSMATWPRRIDLFERQYDKYFSKDPLFGEDLLDRIHNHVQVLLHSCKNTSIKDVELGSLAEFGNFQKKIERGGWLKITPV